jgi:large conductance mechanosensitive channel
MALIKEFKEFIQRGNVIDLAVGVIVGGAFGKIVSSLVADILMPCVGFISGGIDFTVMQVTLGSGDKAPILKYGAFIQHGVDFTITAFCVFLLVKAINALRAKPAAAATKPAAPPEPTASEKLLTEIRDLLAKQ